MARKKKVDSVVEVAGITSTTDADKNPFDYAQKVSEQDVGLGVILSSADTNTIFSGGIEAPKTTSVDVKVVEGEFLSGKAPEYNATLYDTHQTFFSGDGKDSHLPQPNLNKFYSGRIRDDKSTHGNHPFRDGTYVHTTLALKEERIDGVLYVHTLNTIYRIEEPDVKLLS